MQDDSDFQTAETSFPNKKPAPTSESMLKEFCHLLSIYILLLACRNSGILLCDDPKYKTDRLSLSSEIEKYTRVTRPGVLNALATVFVRHHEIIAVTDISPTTIQVQQPGNHKTLGNCNQKSGCHQSGSVGFTVFFWSYAPDF
jgi:hypothetical protein